MTQTVEAGPRTRRCGSAANSALATVLALLFLAAATLSISHALHNSLHPDDSANHHLCLLCSLAKGQVSGAEVIAVSAVVVSCCWFACHFAEWLLLTGIDFRLSPSRAPPSR